MPAATARQTVTTVMSFFQVKRQVMLHTVAPRTTRTKIGTPARDTVKRLQNAAQASAAALDQRMGRGSVELIATTKMGAVRQRYIERLLGWPRVPATRSS